MVQTQGPNTPCPSTSRCPEGFCLGNRSGFQPSCLVDCFLTWDFGPGWYRARLRRLSYLGYHNDLAPLQLGPKARFHIGMGQRPR